ncbi:class I SAM-dependent DNA methyltransferase [Paenibacillus chartarius]|uniref:Class I SAM-dependent DNA methyltransferase n=1 Tax=Paenibacillus chartarius TaxID=747481 RepID=A0ABV6DT56_9BACL
MSYEQFASVYDRLMADMPYPDWLHFAESAWASYGIRPRRVVDLGCGTGTLTIPLAAKGYRMTGIDLSEQMLAVAQSKLEAAQSGSAAVFVDWQQQDMRDWAAAEPVDAVISFCDCLNYLTEEADIVATIRTAYRNLAPGGVLAFDVHTPRQLEEYAAAQPFTLDEDDIAYIWTCVFEEERCQIEHSITFFHEQASGLFRRFEETHVQRAYPLDWIAEELERAGFRDIRLTADFTGRAPTEESERAFFTAVK